jgi:hypothetical protein
MDGLRDRGLLDAAGRLTDAGRAARTRIESLTDALAAAPSDGLEPLELAQLMGSSCHPPARAADPARRNGRDVRPPG